VGKTLHFAAVAVIAAATYAVPNLSAAGTFTVSPGSLTFPVTAVGSTSASQAVTATNNTGASVTISKIQLTAPNAGDFKITATTCGASLANAASCTVTLVFKPVVNDIREATLQFTDTASGSPQVVSVLGTAEAATQTLIFTPPVMTFPVTTLGSPATQVSVTVTNYGTTAVSFNGTSIIGTNPGDFSVANNNCTNLAPNVSSCSITVNFTPSAAGARLATLEVNNNAPGNPFVVPLVGTGQSAAQTISISPPSYSYGSENVSTASSAQYFAVSNTGVAAVTMNSISLTGADPSDFSITSNGCPGAGSSLAAGQTCYVYVAFSPTATGTRSANLSIADTATGSPQTATLYGVGQPATSKIALVPGTLDLGVEVLHVTSGQIYVQAQNTGTSNVTFSNIALGGTNASDFAISLNTCTGALPPNNYCVVYVSFTPSAAGLRTATLTFTDNATGSPQVINVEGTGSTATQVLNFNYVDFAFGAHPVGATSNQQYFGAYNAGDSPVTFTNITLAGNNPGDFAITSQGCPVSSSTLTPGGTCYVYVDFTPSATGLRTATLQYTDSATGSPQSIVLDGIGLAPSQTVTFINTTPSLAFQGTALNTSAGGIYATLQNIGNENVTINNVAVNGTTDFAISSNGCATTLSPGGSCSVLVTDTPTVPGVESATLQFTDNATGSPQSISLAGDGEPAGGSLNFTGTLLYYGSVNTGATAPSPSTITVFNETGSTVSFTEQIVGPNSSDFSFVTNTCNGSLVSGGNCSFSVNFTPGGVGQRLGAVQFTASGVSQQVLLAGVGTAASTLVTLQSVADFGLVNLGTSSAPIAVQVQNSGSPNITFSAPVINGTNASDFTLSQDTCSVLVNNQTCAFSIVFAPSAANVRTASLKITDSATGSPQTVPLTGLGQTAGKILDVPSAVDFGRSNQGTPVTQNINLVNGGTAATTISAITITGGNAADFAISQGTCTVISPFSTCTIQITFNPTGAGVRTTTLKIHDDSNGSPQSITLIGVGVAPVATLNVAPALAFPATIVGTTNLQNTLIQNTGTSPITISSLSISGTNAADFTVYSSCGSNQIAPGNECYVTVAFAPSAAGTRIATLSIASNGTGSPQSVPLTGFGQAGVSTLSLPLAIVFPATLGGAISNQSFYIYNTGNQVVTFSNVAIVGSTDFRVGSWCPQITPGGACQITVYFSPSSPHITTGQLQFTDTAAGSPQSVLLQGSALGKTQTIGLSTNALTFSAQTVGTVSGAQTVFVYNNGTGPVTMNSVTIGGTNPGDFAVTYDNCLGNGSQLNAGSYCLVQVSFAPAATGARSATLTITDNAVGGAQSVALAGTGQ